VGSPRRAASLMSKKRILFSAAVIAIGVLVYTQFRTWRKFDWATFRSQTSEVNWLMVISAIALIYLTYVLRALRWKIFLRPVCHASAVRLIPPTIIGFAGLALLGRPGEFIRPYAIARKEGLNISSQFGVWTVERIFDLGAFTLLAAVDIFTASSLPHPEIFQKAGFVLIAIVLGLSVGAYFMRLKGESVAAWLERRFQGFAPKFAVHLSARARAFSEGLNTIHDLSSFLQLVGVSLGIWFAITLSYLQVAHAYPALRHFPYSDLMLLVGFSMVGGIVQLPAIGGGSQLATILALAHIFDVRQELAVSCGILLWLVTFVSVTPTGLYLARREHISLRKLTQQSQAAEEKSEEEDQPPDRVRSHPDS
jgi:uncharacterized protein (TIRG00374 family)